MFEPGFGSRRAPKCLALRILEVPLDRLQIGIDRLIVRAVDLDAVAVGIEDIEEEGVGDAVASRTALDVADPAGGRHQIEQVDDVERCRHPEGGVVQTRAAAIGEGDIVDAALAVGPGSPETAGFFVLSVLRDAEAEFVIEGDALVDIGREAVEMVDAQRLHAFVEGVFLMDRRQAVHLRIEFKGDAVRIAGAEGPRLVGALDPFDRQVLALEEMRCLVEILVAEDLEAEVAGFRLIGFLEHDAVMAALLHCPEIDRIRGLVRHLQAERIDIEGARLGKIGDAEFDMAEAHDVEGRIEIGFRQGHGFLLFMRIGGSAAEFLDGVRLGGEGDVLGFHVEIEGPVAAVAADAGILDPTEGGRQVAHIFRIHPDHAGFEMIGETEGAGDVGGPEIARQAVLDIVGKRERIGFILEGDGGQHRPEDFLLGDAHLVVGAGKQSRGDIATAARAVQFLAAGCKGRALRPADLDIFQHLLFMHRMNKRANDRFRIQRMPDLDALGLLGNDRGELVVDAFLDQQARGGGAALAVQRIDHEDGGIGGALQIGIGKDDDRVLAAELEMHPLQRVGALLHDHRAGAAFADEADGLDQGMLRQRAAGILAEAVDEVPNALRQAGFLGNFHQQTGGQRREFGGLVDDGAAGSQCRRDLPGRQHEGGVPGRDDPDRADRNARRQVHLAFGADRLAVTGFRRAIGKEAEVLGAAQCSLGHEFQRLSGIHALDEGDLFSAGHDRIGNLVQKLLAGVTRHGSPFGKGCFCGFCGAIDIGSLAAGNGGKRLQIDR
ncbi:hypothetical protein RHSP_43422 [Rhizobium freirei PRF 81]|uniref:Uncharacterized protein n=1 Tax=Rhizobium freirei PRF 81 TaxID=363754 RepID=N6U856_9HYPH|nr:hypothetical protein RHSP_43422 [Rhizobium freirei PRF 81]